MFVARVIGNVWATKKHSTLEKMKLLLVQSLDANSGELLGEPSLAVDKQFSAGPGDTVLVMDEGNSARQILNNKSAPVRLVICGIVDAVSIKTKTLKYH
jgi:microcompartment protein CcmK/EutM